MLAQSCQDESGNRQVHSESSLPAPEFSPLDVQYEICSKFMKMANEQLYTREIELMQVSSHFLDKVQESFSYKDISSTQESMTLLDTFLEEEDVFQQPSKSRLLLRKSTSNSTLRRTESGLNQALREVARKCSEKTSSMLSNLAGEFRKLKQKLAGSEKFQKELKRLQARLASTQEDLLISRKRVSDLQKEGQIQNDKVKSLQKRLREASDQAKSSSLILSRSSEHLPQLPNTAPTQKIKRFLQEKQVHVFKKQKQIRVIQDRIQNALEGSMGGGCDKCCQMMKRIKESIMKYRLFLEEEVTVTQQCYQNLKKQFN